LTLTLTFIMDRYQMSSEQISTNLKHFGIPKHFAEYKAEAHGSSKVSDFITTDLVDCTKLESTYEVEAIRNPQFDIDKHGNVNITFSHGSRKYQCPFVADGLACCEMTSTSVNGLRILPLKTDVKRKSSMTYWNTQKKVVEPDTSFPAMTVRFQHFTLDYSTVNIDDGSGEQSDDVDYILPEDTAGKVVADFCMGKRFNEDTIVYRFVCYNKHNGFYSHIFRVIADGKVEKLYCL